MSNIENVRCFFTPKLTKEELKLVNDKDEQHLMTYADFLSGVDPDVNEEEMKQSDSKDKYVHCFCWRRTVRLSRTDESDEDEIDFEELLEKARAEYLKAIAINGEESFRRRPVFK